MVWYFYCSYSTILKQWSNISIDHSGLDIIYYIFFWKMSLYKKVSNSCQTFMLLHVSSDVAVWQGFISNKWTFCSIGLFRMFQREIYIFLVLLCEFLWTLIIWVQCGIYSIYYFLFIFCTVKIFCPFGTFYFFQNFRQQSRLA